jgi:hypothetical protein
VFGLKERIAKLEVVEKSKSEGGDGQETGFDTVGVQATEDGVDVDEFE